MGVQVLLPDPRGLPDGYTIVIEADGGTTVFSSYRGTWEAFPKIDMDPYRSVYGHEPTTVESWWFTAKHVFFDAMEWLDRLVHHPVFLWSLVLLAVVFVLWRIGKESEREH